ncbi:MAG: manganese efflux pump [Alistipes sp.]|nr:manganese efflux pump [Alistipes sp.]
MTIFDLILLAVGVSMDAFAVSIAKGLATPSVRPKHYCSVAVWFGGFQALMPLIGYFIGVNFIDAVERFDHWIAFALLAIIGGKMLYDCIFGNEEEDNLGASYSFKTMLLLAVATSIDALAVGVSLAVLKVNIWSAVAFIGATTALFSAFGLRLGNAFGSRYKRGAEITGGVVLIAIGVKILIEHLS